MNDCNETIERFEDDEPCNCQPGHDDYHDGRREKFDAWDPRVEKSYK